MGLTIVTKNKFDHVNEATFHIPFGKIAKDINEIASHVTEIQADGHELEYIRQRFGNKQNDSRSTVPFVSTFALPRVMRWFGDDAKFIIGNLT